MADNVEITTGSGTDVAADEISSVKYQRIKLIEGADGTNDGDISSSNPLPVEIIDTDATVAADIGSIKTAVETLDNAISGTEMQVDVVAALPVGSNLIGNVKISDGTETANVNASNELQVRDDDANTDLDTIAGAVTGSEMQVDIVADGAGLATETTLDSVKTAVEVIDNAIATEGSALGSGVLLQGDDGTDRKNINVDATTGDVQVDVTNTITETNSAAILADTASMDTNLGTVAGAVSGTEMQVDIVADGAGLALESGGNLDTIAGDTTAIQTAVEIMDDWDATHDSAASSDGVQLMGAYDSTKPSAVADGDAVRVLSDEYGRILTGLEPEWFNDTYDSSDATSEGETVKAATASKKIYITSFIISSDVEGWIKLQDEDSNALTGKFWLKAGGGVSWSDSKCPIVLDTANKALEVIAEAAGDVSVTVSGYLAP